VLAGFRLGVTLGGRGGNAALGGITAPIGGDPAASLLDFITGNPGGVEVRFKRPDPAPDIYISPGSHEFTDEWAVLFELIGIGYLDGTVIWYYGNQMLEGNAVYITPDFGNRPDTVTAVFTPAHTNGIQKAIKRTVTFKPRYAGGAAKLSTDPPTKPTYTNDTYESITVSTGVTYKDPQPETFVLDDIIFQNTSMFFWKGVSDYQHLGVFTEQSVKFRVNTKPYKVNALDGKLTWGGLASGNTMEVNVTFVAPNADMEEVNVTDGKTTLKANVAIRDKPAGVGEEIYAGLRPVTTGLLVWHNVITSTGQAREPWEWAAATYPGNQINTKADAARHAYWTCLMARYGNERYARGLSTAHEVSAPGPANETVMDLHNNAMGIQIAGNHTHSSGFQCCRDAVQQALADGLLWHMDDPANEEQKGLLQPTNK